MGGSCRIDFYPVGGNRSLAPFTHADVCSYSDKMKARWPTPASGPKTLGGLGGVAKPPRGFGIHASLPTAARIIARCT